MSDQALDERWRETPALRRVFLATAVMFTVIGGLDSVLFVIAQQDSATALTPWAGAFGLTLGLNALFWLFAWRPGTFRRPGPCLLAAVLLVITFCALHLGGRAFSAACLGVGIADL